MICLSLGSLLLHFNWAWQVRQKVKELEITSTTKTVEPKKTALQLKAVMVTAMFLEEFVNS